MIFLCAARVKTSCDKFAQNPGTDSLRHSGMWRDMEICIYIWYNLKWLKRRGV
jgi:hypothetical protein